MDHQLAEPEFWRNSVSSGMFITIKDARELMEGEGLNGTDYTIKFIRTFKDSDEMGEWIFFYLESNDEPVWLLVRIVNEEIEFRVYDASYNDDFFKEGNREDMIDWEQNWIFKEPENVETFSFGDLEYNDSLFVDGPDGKEVQFDKKDFSPLYGETKESPVQMVEDSVVSVLVEYSTASESPEYSEILILEIGEEDNGGLISFLIGDVIELHELEVIG